MNTRNDINLRVKVKKLETRNDEKSSSFDRFVMDLYFFKFVFLLNKMQI